MGLGFCLWIKLPFTLSYMLLVTEAQYFIPSRDVCVQGKEILDEVLGYFDRIRNVRQW